MSKSIRVIGIGSPLEGDDIGMRLVEQLRDDPHWSKQTGIEWQVLERPGASLLEYFESAETVVIIDALRSDDHEGVVRIKPDDLLVEASLLSSHHVGVAETLQLAAALNQLPLRLMIYGVGEHPDSFTRLTTMLDADLGCT